MVPMLIAGAVIWANADPVTAPEGDAIAFHTWTAQDPAYEGGRTACRRCHLREFRSWEGTAHANALEALPEESRTDANCVKCHTTGYGKGGFTSVADTPDLANVTCEACHGPGSLYKDKEVMEDQAAATAAGLVIPNEATCTGCHNSESPTFPGSFNFEEMKAKGVHQIPAG